MIHLREQIIDALIHYSVPTHSQQLCCNNLQAAGGVLFERALDNCRFVT